MSSSSLSTNVILFGVFQNSLEIMYHFPPIVWQYELEKGNLLHHLKFSFNLMNNYEKEFNTLSTSEFDTGVVGLFGLIWDQLYLREDEKDLEERCPLEKKLEIMEHSLLAAH